LTLGFLADGQTADAADVLTPITETADALDAGRETVSISPTDTHNKQLEDALTAGSGVSITKTGAGGDEALSIALDGAGSVYVTPTGTETLTNKTLTAPTVGDFTNATHDHEDAAGGGQLTVAAIDSETATSGHVLTANGSGGVSFAAAGGGGAAPIDITVTAGEALSERDVVFVDASDGKAYKADADATTPLLGAIRGVVNEAGGISNAGTGSVRISGDVSGFTGLSAWGTVYAGTTAGGYTQTRPDPTNGGGQVAVVPMGYAVSTTAIMVQPGPVAYLKRETLADAATTTITHHDDPQGRTRQVSAYIATTITSSTDSFTGGTASASTAFGANTAAQGVDNNNSTYWQADEAGSGDPSTWKYDLGSGNGVALVKYSMRARATGGRWPTDWTFEGSNNDSSWTTLDTKSSETFTNGQRREFTFTNTTSYRYYRFVFTGADLSGGSQFATVAEFEGFATVLAQDEPCVIGRSSGGTRDVGVRFDDGSGSDADTKTTFKNTMGTSADLTVSVVLE